MSFLTQYKIIHIDIDIVCMHSSLKLLFSFEIVFDENGYYIPQLQSKSLCLILYPILQGFCLLITESVHLCVLISAQFTSTGTNRIDCEGRGGGRVSKNGCREFIIVYQSVGGYPFF